MLRKSATEISIYALNEPENWWDNICYPMNVVPKPEDNVETKYDMAIHFCLFLKGQTNK